MWASKLEITLGVIEKRKKKIPYFKRTFSFLDFNSFLHFHTFIKITLNNYFY